jgi:hypothetical protein
MLASGDPIVMLSFMLKNVFHPRTGAEAMNPLCAHGTFNVVVRLAAVVLISILITHFHAEPV